MGLENHEAVSLALGSVSIFGQTLSACMRGFEKYNSAKDLSTDAIELRVNLEWTRSRLETWSEGWDIENGSHLSNPHFQKYGQMTINHLVFINYILAELGNVDDIFPTLRDAATYAPTSPAISLARLSRTAGVSLDELEALRRKIEQLDTDAGHVEKARWALEEKGPLKMAATVKGMVEDLFLQFPPPEGDVAGLLVKNKILQSDREEWLDAAARNAESNPVLSALTLLKVEALRLEQRATNMKSADPDRDFGVLVEEKIEGKRGTGKYFNQEERPYQLPILIEVKEVGNSLRTDDHHKRIRNIARLLSMKDKPSEMRTLDCIGVVSISERDSTIHKLLYQLPAPKFFTLSSVLSGRRNTLPLGKKFACAKILCRAVLYLHLAGWLHKGLRSDNVVFCAAEEADCDLAQPYLCGFEYSRQAAVPQDTAPVDDDVHNNLYRHPDVQGVPTFRIEYQRMHDVYALGMILLELGSSRSLRRLKKKYQESSQPLQNWTAEGFRTWILENINGTKSDFTLAPLMGEIYTEVVDACLRGFKNDDGRSFVETFFLKIVRRIDSCVA